MPTDIPSLPTHWAAPVSFLEEGEFCRKSVKSGDEAILLVAAGDAKIDNAKFKAAFALKPRMLDAETVVALTGHPIGGVCPFGLATDIPVYIDVSVQRFTTVFPACGSRNSAIELTPEELFTHAKAVRYVDVCKEWDAAL